MQLDKLIIETRLRSGWSAIDLGFALARRFYLRSLAVYLVLALPVFALTRLLGDSYYLLPYLIFWWLKPVFERPILFILSRELFDERMEFRQTLRHWKQWLLPGLLFIITSRRLSFTRGMYAPITLLERPTSSQYSMRTTVLGSRYANEASWLTIVLYHFEQIFGVAALVLFGLFFPDQVKFVMAWFNEYNESSVYFDLVALLTMAIIAPFYAAAGFMLYISRRVELEGWDIEICFRDWMANFKPPGQRPLTQSSSSSGRVQSEPQ